MTDTENDFHHWRAQRQAELAGPESSLGLVALVWLEEGANSVGSAAECAVRLPQGPEHLGTLTVTGEQVAWQEAAPGLAVVEAGGDCGGGAWQLATDAAGAPSRVVAGYLVFFVIERGGRLAVRLRDRDWAAREPFPGLDCFPFDPAWRVVARWETLAPPLTMEVPDVTGDLKSVVVAHQAVFTAAGQTVALLPMSVGDGEVFFVFRDRTSGGETYGAGRFLKAAPARDGRITLDFNRAYNPPCAFTPFATCPLPPPENWLPFAVPAGERKWSSAGK